MQVHLRVTQFKVTWQLPPTCFLRGLLASVWPTRACCCSPCHTPGRSSSPGSTWWHLSVEFVESRSPMILELTYKLAALILEIRLWMVN